MDKIVNIGKKTLLIISALGIILVGLFILSITLFALKNYKEFEGEATAIITKIDVIPGTIMDDDGEIINDHDVYVKYEVNGRSYEDIKLNSYDSSMKVGDEVFIKYNLDNPREIQTPGGKTLIYIFIGVSSLATLFGGYQLVKGIRYKEDLENN